MPNPLVRQYTAVLHHDADPITVGSVTLHHESDLVYLTTVTILPNERPAAVAVRSILTAERAPLSAVQRVYEWPTCDYCYRVATRYVVGTAILLVPLCESCADDRTDRTAELDVDRLPEVPRDQWEG